MHRIALALGLAALLVFLPFVRAADAPAETIPPNLGGYLSIKSFDDFLSKVDKAVVESTVGTAQAKQEGYFLEMAEEGFPVPFEYWDTSGELRVFFSVDFKKMALLLPVGNYRDFLKFFEENGETVVSADIGDTAAAEIDRGSNGVDIAVLDYGEGTVAVSRDLVTLVELAAISKVTSWMPPAPEDTDIWFLGNVATLVKQNVQLDTLLSSFDAERDKITDEAESIGLSRPVITALMDKARIGMEAVGDELLQTDYFEVKGKIAKDGKWLWLTASLASRPGSYLADLGAFWTDPTRTNGGLRWAEVISPGPLFVNATAPIHQVIPGAPETIALLVDGTLDTAYPKQKDKLVNQLREYWSLMPNSFVNARYAHEDAMYDLYITRGPEAAACVDKVAAIFDTTNEMLAETIVAGKYAGEFASTRLREGDFAYLRIQPELDDPEIAALLLGLLRQAYPGANYELGLPNLFRFYIGAKDDVVLILTGSGLTDADLPRLAAMLEEPESLLESEAAQQVVANLTHTQVSVGVMDVDQAVRTFMHQAMAPQLATLGPIIARSHRNALAGLPPSGKALGIAIGSDNGRICMELTTGTDAINAIIVQTEAYMRDLIAGMARAAQEEIEENDDGFETDEDLEDEAEEDEIVLDEEPATT